MSCDSRTYSEVSAEQGGISRSEYHRKKTETMIVKSATVTRTNRITTMDNGVDIIEVPEADQRPIADHVHHMYLSSTEMYRRQTTLPLIICFKMSKGYCWKRIKKSKSSSTNWNPGTKKLKTSHMMWKFVGAQGRLHSSPKCLVQYYKEVKDALCRSLDDEK